MNKGKETFQRILAVIIIIAMLGVIGIPFSVVIFFAIVAYFIWRAVQKTELQESVHIFEFYISANDILRDEERRWFGFEINEIISHGERILHSMSDPPPLVYFALGVLYHTIGNHESAEKHLAYIVENDFSNERHRIMPSRELKSYAHVLRKIEREPTEAPLTVAAVRSLERARRLRASALLEKTREELKKKPLIEEKTNGHKKDEPTTFKETPSLFSNVSTPVLAPPPPIAEVLHDLYETEEVKSKK